jgi:maleylpyruvate isomerase
VAHRPAADIDGVLRSHRRLLATVTSIDDATAARPSLLPGWDVAMLVTHLARNADGHAFAAEGARLGERRQRYPDRAARDAGIEAGRGRTAADLLDDFSGSMLRLEAAWEALPPEAWSLVAADAGGDDEPVVELPRFRWRETEIHHVDLGLAFTTADWDDEFVRTELDRWGPGIGERLVGGGAAVVATTDTGQSWSFGDPASARRVEAPACSILEWLIGRGAAGFPSLGPWSW